MLPDCLLVVHGGIDDSDDILFSVMRVPHADGSQTQGISIEHVHYSDLRPLTFMFSAFSRRGFGVAEHRQGPLVPRMLDTYMQTIDTLEVRHFEIIPFLSSSPANMSGHVMCELHQSHIEDIPLHVSFGATQVKTAFLPSMGWLVFWVDVRGIVGAFSSMAAEAPFKVPTFGEVLWKFRPDNSMLYELCPFSARLCVLAKGVDYSDLWVVDF